MTDENKVQIIIGLVEPIKIISSTDSKTYLARIDTGALRSSIDKKIAQEFKLGPVIREVIVKNAQGKSKRPVVKVNIEMAKQNFDGEFTIADRSHMKFPILIGRDILNKGFLIDATKGFEGENNESSSN